MSSIGSLANQDLSPNQPIRSSSKAEEESHPVLGSKRDWNLAPPNNLNLNQPRNCHKAAIDRIYLAKQNTERIKLDLKFFKKTILRNQELKYLGYCSMHICWAVCMFNNFCPISKYTILRECKKYFSVEDFKSIKKAYNFYGELRAD